MIKVRTVDCTWQIVLECYLTDHCNLLEILDSHDTRDDAIAHISNFHQNLTDASRCAALKIRYHEEIIHETPVYEKETQ